MRLREEIVRKKEVRERRRTLVTVPEEREGGEEAKASETVKR